MDTDVMKYILNGLIEYWWFYGPFMVLCIFAHAGKRIEKEKGGDK